MHGTSQHTLQWWFNVKLALAEMPFWDLPHHCLCLLSSLLQLEVLQEMLLVCFIALNQLSYGFMVKQSIQLWVGSNGTDSVGRDKWWYRPNPVAKLYLVKAHPDSMSIHKILLHKIRCLCAFSHVIPWRRQMFTVRLKLPLLLLFQDRHVLGQAPCHACTCMDPMCYLQKFLLHPGNSHGAEALYQGCVGNH